jgi:hypothetical protein
MDPKAADADIAQVCRDCGNTFTVTARELTGSTCAG